MNQASYLLVSLCILNGWGWVAIDRQILGVIDDPGLSKAEHHGHVVAVFADLPPRVVGDTVAFTLDLHDSAPTVIQRIDSLEDLVYYEGADSSVRGFCVGATGGCLVRISSTGRANLEDALVERFVRSHVEYLEPAADSVSIERLLLEPLLNSEVIVQLEGGRFARVQKSNGRLQFDSVEVREEGVIPHEIELFSLSQN